MFRRPIAIACRGGRRRQAGGLDVQSQCGNFGLWGLADYGVVSRRAWAVGRTLHFRLCTIGCRPVAGTRGVGCSSGGLEMRVLLLSLLCVAGLGLQASAQQSWPPQIEGQRHVYKQVGDTQLNLWVLRSGVSNAPAIVFFFGGGWTSGTPEQFLPQARYLATRGITAVVADYRVASRHKVQAVSCVEDAKSAVRWLRGHAAELGIDPQRICAAGGSAGGHIACCTALIEGLDGAGEDLSISSVPNALALFNPAVMLGALDGFKLSEQEQQKLQSLAARTGVDPVRISPIHHVRPGMPPTIVFHGETDSTVSIATVAEFEKRMVDAGNRCELKRFSGAPHGFFNLREGRGVNGERQREWHLRTLQQLDVFLTSLGWSAGQPGLPVVDNDNVHVRGHLQSALTRIAGQPEARVAFLGGSITEMEGYRPLVEKWLTERFPQTKFSFIRAGISSTCSNTGAFRFQRDVAAHGPVDLLLVEFAVNDDQDAHHDADGCVRGMEGILRQLWRHNAGAGAVMLHFVNPEMLATAQAGNMQLSAKQHEAVARHYGVSSIDLPAELADRIADGTMSWDSWGGTHPGPAGNRHTADLVIQVLKSALAGAGGAYAEQAEVKLPEPLLASSYADGGFLSAEAVHPGAGWQLGIPDWNALPGSKRERFTGESLYYSEQPGAELKLEFAGTAVGAYVLAGPDAGRLEVRLDGGEWKPVELYHNYSAGLHYPRTVMFASDLAAGRHVVDVRVASEKHEKSRGHAARVLQFVVNGAAVSPAQ